MFARGGALERGGLRDRLAARTAGAILLSRGVAFGCLLARTGLALNHLGPGAFGLWMAATGAAGFLQFADLGIGNSLQNRLSAAHGRQDAGVARDLFFAGTFWLLILAAAAFLLGAVLIPLLPWAAIFGVRDPALAARIQPLLWVSLGAVCSGIPCSAPQRLAVALQQGWMASAASAVSGLLSVLTLWFAVRAGAGPAGCAAWVAAPNLAVAAGLGLWLVRRLGWKLWGGGTDVFRRQAVLLREGLGFLFLQGAGLVATSLPPVLLAAVLGPAAVTPFTLATQMASALTQFQAAWLQPLWPAYAEAQASGDGPWIRRTFKRSVQGTLLLLPGCLLLALFGQAAAGFLGADTGSIPGPGLLGWMAVWTAGCMLTAPVATLLNGMGHVSGQAIYGTLSAVLAALVLPRLAGILGPAGAPAALAAGHLLLSLPLSYLEAWRRLGAGSASRVAAALFGWILSRCRSWNPRHQPFLCIYKCDGYGDFVLASGAIRSALERSPGPVLLVCYAAGDVFAETEFPQLRRVVLPEPGPGLSRFVVLLRQWAILRQIAPESVLCLRHQRTLRDDVVLRLLGDVPCPAPASESAAEVAGIQINRELLRHHAALACLFRTALPDILPRLHSVVRREAGYALVAPFGGYDDGSLRNLPDWQVQEALHALSSSGVRRILVTGLAPHKLRAHRFLREAGLPDGCVEWVQPGGFMEFARLVAGASVVFSTDSAAAHLACALDVPMVAVLAGAHHGEFAPWGRPGRQIWVTHELPCFGCDWRCPYPVPACIHEIPRGGIAAALEAVRRKG